MSASPLVNAINFATNHTLAPSPLFTPAQFDALAHLISSLGAEPDRLALPVPCDESAYNLAEAIRGSGTVSTLVLRFEPFCGVKAIRTVTAALESRPDRICVSNFNPDSNDLRFLVSLLIPHHSAIITIEISGTWLPPEQLAELRHIRALRSLRLQLSYFDSAPAARALEEAIHEWPLLERLELFHANLSGRAGFARALGGCRVLSALELTCNGLLDIGISEIANAMLSRSKLAVAGLRELRLADNEFGARGGVEVAKLVRRSPQLEWLDISSNNLGEEAGTIFGEALQGCASSLRTLKVSSCGFGPEAIRAIGNSLSPQSRLASLDISQNSPGKHGIDAMLPTIAGLTKLNVGSTGIPTRGLATELAKCRFLRVLDLSELADVGGDIGLFEALPGSLEKLELFESGIDNEAAKAVSRFILRAPRLKRLGLGMNKFDAEGVRAVSEALLHWGSIQDLSLSFNYDMGDQGAKLVAQNLIRSSKSLRKLDIRQQCVGAEGATAIAQAIVDVFHTGGSKLREVRIMKGEGGKEGYEALERAMLEVRPEIDVVPWG